MIAIAMSYILYIIFLYILVHIHARALIITKTTHNINNVCYSVSCMYVCMCVYRVVRINSGPRVRNLLCALMLSVYARNASIVLVCTLNVCSTKTMLRATTATKYSYTLVCTICISVDSV